MTLLITLYSESDDPAARAAAEKGYELSVAAANHVTSIGKYSSVEISVCSNYQLTQLHFTRRSFLSHGVQYSSVITSSLRASCMSQPVS